MFRKYTIAEEILNRFSDIKSEKSKLITDITEKIQAAILFEVNGFPKEKSKEYGKEYQGDLSDEIIEVLISGFSQLNNEIEKMEIREALKFYADAENYEEQEYRTPHCHSWWDDSAVKADKGKRAKEVLGKYFAGVKK